MKHFTVAEYLFLRKVMLHEFGIPQEKMSGDSHMSGGFMSLKIINTKFTPQMLVKTNTMFNERFGMKLIGEQKGTYFWFTKS